MFGSEGDAESRWRALGSIPPPFMSRSMSRILEAMLKSMNSLRPFVLEVLLSVEEESCSGQRAPSWDQSGGEACMSGESSMGELWMMRLRGSEESRGVTISSIAVC